MSWALSVIDPDGHLREQISEEETQHLKRVKRQRLGEFPDWNNDNEVGSLFGTSSRLSMRSFTASQPKLQQRTKRKSGDPTTKPSKDSNREGLFLLFNQKLDSTHRMTMKLLEEMLQVVSDLKANSNTGLVAGSESVPQEQGDDQNSTRCMDEEQLKRFMSYFQLTCQMLQSCEKSKLSDSSRTVQNLRLIHGRLREIQYIRELLKSHCNYNIPEPVNSASSFDFLASEFMKDNSTLDHRGDQYTWDYVVSYLQHMVLEMKKSVEAFYRRRVVIPKTPEFVDRNPKKRRLPMENVVDLGENEMGLRHIQPIKYRSFLPIRTSFEPMETD